MIRIRDSFLIERPLEVVFAYVANVENLPAWAKGVRTSRHVTGGEPGQGSRFEVVGFMGPRRLTVIYRLDEFEPNKRFRARGDFGPFRFDELFSFAAEGSSTRVTLQTDMEPTGLARLVAPLASPLLQRQLRGDNRRLKRVLEKGTS